MSTREHQLDRFIPQRPTAIRSEINHYKLMNPNAFNTSGLSTQEQAYRDSLALSLFGRTAAEIKKSPMLQFNGKKSKDYHNPSNSFSFEPSIKRKRRLRYQLEPTKVLDAPGIRDDFYPNPLDWANNGILGIALDDEIYAYDYQSQQITGSISYQQQLFSAVSHSSNSQYLLTGTTAHKLLIFDATTHQLTKKFNLPHSDICYSLIADTNPAVFFAGTQQGLTYRCDLRTPPSEFMTFNNRVNEGKGKVCGLKLNTQYMACGLSINGVQVWDKRHSSSPLFTITAHDAGVKALAFHHSAQTTLMTGGRVSDKTLKIWDLSGHTPIQLTSYNTGEQITSVMNINSQPNCFISTQGKSITHYHFDRATKKLTKNVSTDDMGSDTQHQQRILASSQSPDGKFFATVGADETLRFWQPSPRQEQTKPKRESSFGIYSIR